MAVRSDLSAFWSDEGGATAIEYGLIVSLIFLVCVTAMGMFGSNTTAMYDKINAAVSGATR